MQNYKPAHVRIMKPGETIELNVLLTLDDDGKTVGLSLFMPEQESSIVAKYDFPLERITAKFCESFNRLIPHLFKKPTCAKSSPDEQLDVLE